jgi:hypothetical protein
MFVGGERQELMISIDARTPAGGQLLGHLQALQRHRSYIRRSYLGRGRREKFTAGPRSQSSGPHCVIACYKAVYFKNRVNNKR